MSYKKLSICLFFAAAIIFSVMPGQTTHAQEFPFIESLYPQQGTPGRAVDLLLRGGGFENIEALNAVAISGIEVPVFDYAVLSDEAVEVRILIPEDMPVGVTEITFVFDDFGEDALFIVSADSAAPLEFQLSPQEGQLGTEVTLQLETFNDSLGPFGGMTIWGVELPVLASEVNEAGDAWFFRVFMPPEIPPGDGEIRMYFENYAINDYFFVIGPEFDQPLGPAVYGYDPNEGQRGTEIDMVLEGTAMSDLGDLVGITLAGIELEILEYSLESEEFAVLRTYLPPELPLGETRIAFFHEFYGPYTDIFRVNPQESVPDEQRQPVLTSISPQEGERDSELLLRLGGENLEELGELVGVWIGDYALPEIDYDVLTNNTSVVYAYLPDDAPDGDQTITIAFENAEISTAFLVVGNGFPFWLLVLVGIVGIFGIGVLLGGGFLAARAVRRGRADDTRPDEPRRERQPRFEFKVETDFGHQTIEPAGGSLTMDLNLRFEVFKDPGEQEIEAGGGSLIDES